MSNSKNDDLAGKLKNDKNFDTILSRIETHIKESKNKI